MKHYMRTWRLNRKLADERCECGNRGRVALGKGCARCEAMDRERYKGERSIDIVRRIMARFDLVSTAELAIACAVTEAQVRNALGSLIEHGEVEVVGASTATEYRLRRAA